MSTRRYSDFLAPSIDDHKLGRWASGAADAELINAIVSTYAETRRNQAAAMYNCEGPSFTYNSEDDLPSRFWFRVPIEDRIVRRGGSGQLKIWMLVSTSVETAGHQCRFSFSIGGQEQGEVVALNTAKTWKNTTVNLSVISPADRYLTVYRSADSTGVSVNVYSICMAQPGDTSATYIDMTGAYCMVGVDDQSDNALQRRLLVNNLLAVRGQKTMRGNVLSRWLYPAQKTGVYDADHRGLGAYKFFKRAGVSTLRMNYLAYKSGVNDWTLRAEVNGTANTATMSATTPTWYTMTWTFTGSDITDEIELELILDGDESAGTTQQMLPHIELFEQPATAISYTVPDVSDAILPSKILASTWNNARDTLDHLYQRGGCQICVADYRATYNGQACINTQCNTTAFLKNDTSTTGSSVIMRTMVFPSTGTIFLRVWLGFYTVSTAGSDRIKSVNQQLSDSTIFATWDDVHPRYADNSNGAWQLTEDVSAADYREMWCYLAVDSADWESYGLASQPLQVWQMAATDNVDEYVMPLFASVEEVVIPESRFP